MCFQFKKWQFAYPIPNRDISLKIVEGRASILPHFSHTPPLSLDKNSPPQFLAPTGKLYELLFH